jgi:ketosteroid isomerase-like protein
MATNTDFVRGGYEAFARGDAADVFGRFAPDIEWLAPVGFPNGIGGTYQGHEDVAGFFGKLTEVYGEDLGVEIEEYIEAGNRVVAIGRIQVRSTSGRPVSARVAHYWTLADGKVTRFEELFDTAELARQLAG